MIELLKRDLIKVRSASSTKDEILNEISEMVSNMSSILSKEAIYSALLDREDLSSTGLGSSLAIPHCAFDKIDDFYVGLIVSDPIDFDSFDGEPVQLIFFSIGSKTDQCHHISTLTSISKIAMNGDTLQTLMDSNSADEVFKILSQENL